VRRLTSLLLALSALLPAAAAAEPFPGQQLVPLSPNADGESRNPAISQDKRWGRMVAFESAATNLAPGAGGGWNIFVVERAGGYGENGSPWSVGRTMLASKGLNGAPANGPSTRPSMSGTSRVPPRCVAFVSEASNLVAGDTNGKADAFVHDLVTGRTERVSLNSAGRQSAGSVTEVVVNGLCTRVAFVSDAGDLALTKTKNPSWKSAVTEPSPAGRRQVYIRHIGGTTRLDRELKGLTFLASATDRGIPADGPSYDVAFAVNSRAVTYTSEGGNLSPADPGPAPDVYHRVMTRRYGAPIKGRKPQYLAMETSLISSGRGASYAPATNVDGTTLAYATTDPQFATNGLPQIVKVIPGKAPAKLISRTADGAPGNGASGAPALTAAGAWVLWESDATDVGKFTELRPDVNGVKDVQLFTEVGTFHWVLAERSSGPSTNPMSSPHGNYVVFERDGQVHLNYVGAK
jgi:hypothetical protein